MAKKERKMKVDGQSLIGSLGAENLGLPRPYGSAPQFPGKHCLYINKDEGRLVVVFAATYAAKKFLDALLEDDEISYVKGITNKMDTIVSSTGIRVRCSEIKELQEHEYSSKEEQWELDEGSVSTAMRFRSSNHVHNEGPKEDGVVKTAREPREKKEIKPKINRDGLVTIQQICEELKIEPREARGILRKMKTEKPEAGWAWQKSEVDAIKTLLHNNK